MREFLKLTEVLAKTIRQTETKRRKLAELARNAKLKKTAEILEEKIVIKLKKNKISCKVAGVDGGLVKKSFHGIDLMLLRAVGVLFTYADSKLVETRYYPDAIPPPEPRVILQPCSELELEIGASLERQLKEVKVATQLAKEFEPNFLFLHGPILPHYSTQGKDSMLYAKHEEVTDSYLTLFKTIEGLKTILAGIVEDSRGTRFCELIAGFVKLPKDMLVVLEQTRDTNLLTYLLGYGERTPVFTYAKDVAIHPILKNFKELGNRVQVFYIRTAAFDRPLRVEFLADKPDAANRISAVLLATAMHSSYGSPAVLIEADQRAKLTEHELETFYYDLIGRVGRLPGLYERRRELRPFR